MLALIIAVGVVIFTSAMCSLFEAVLYSVPMGHVESLAQGGRPSGRILKGLRSHVDRPIAAILSLNTIANTGGAAIAGALADQHLGTESLGYFSAVFTFAILMFSEIVPKTAGVIFCRPLAAVFALPIQLLVWLFLPFIWLSQMVTRLIARRTAEHRVTDEELLMLAQLGKTSGDLEHHEAEVIENILALEKMTVRDVMTPRTVAFLLDAQLTVEAAGEHRELLNYSRIPVYGKDQEDVVGIVHRRDVLTALAGDRPEVKLEELMKPVHFVLKSMPLDRLLRYFLDRRQHLVVAIDEFGGLSGIVTLEDVLEAILGRQIVDEFDEVSDLRKLAHLRREETLKQQGLGRPSSSSSSPTTSTDLPS